MQLSADQFAEEIRGSNTTFPIKGVVRPKGAEPFSGEGTIRRGGGGFVIHLAFPVGIAIPKIPLGVRIYTQDDYWQFEGTIGENLPVVIKHLDPGGTRHWTNEITSHDFTAETLFFPAVGFDAVPLRAVQKLHRQIEEENRSNDRKVPRSFKMNIPMPPNDERSEEDAKPSPNGNGIWIDALVPDFPLIHKNGETVVDEKNDFLGSRRTITSDTFSGRFDNIQYGLVKRGDDLNVYLFIPDATDEKISLEVHERLLTSFLTGLAFATGQHCWPCRVMIRQNGAVRMDKLTTIHKIDRTPLAPFSERIGFNARAGKVEWDFSDFLGKATRFFNGTTELSEAASKALWLLRAAATKGLPGEITLGSFCILLESLTNLMFDELKLEPSPDTNSFQQAKNQVIAFLDNHDQISEQGFKRIKNVVASASLYRPTDKYRVLCDHFSIKWEGLMKDSWDTWNIVRHKSVHAALTAEAEVPAHDHFTAVGRIAGAINVLILRLIGYTGIARTSVFEDKHHKI